MKIGIVGAGIGGLAIANCLKQSGHQIQVFERTDRITPVGSGLTLWPNATRVLKILGVLDDCVDAGCPLDILSVKLSNGRTVMTIPTEKFETPAIAMHRADLHHALLSPLSEDVFRLGFECQAIREDESGVFIRANELEAGPFDLLIGADGLHSAVRQYVSPRLQLSYKGYLIWRGVANVGSRIAQNGQFSETWGRGQRFGILPIGKGQVCWYATLNIEQGLLPGQDDKKNLILGLYKGWHEPIQELIERTADASIIQTETLDCPQPPRWSRGRVVLLGDAIHPIAANLGQGSCLALEDTLVLSETLRRCRSIAEAFETFERIRRPRVQNVQRRSSWIGGIGQLEKPILTPLRNWICSQVPGRLFTRTSRVLHAYRAEEQVTKSLRF